jgi:hypothetical protein
VLDSSLLKQYLAHARHLINTFFLDAKPQVFIKERKKERKIVQGVIREK